MTATWWVGLIINESHSSVEHWLQTLKITGWKTREHDVTVVQPAVHKTGDKCVECMRRQRPLDGSCLSQCTETRWQDMIDVTWVVIVMSPSMYRRRELSPTGPDARSPDRPWRRCLECGGDDGQVHTSRRAPSWERSAAVCCCDTSSMHSDMISCRGTASCGWHHHTPGCRRRTDDSVDCVSGSVETAGALNCLLS